MLKTISANTLSFDGKNEKFELFEDLFHTMLKMQPGMTEQMKINHFHATLRKDALQTFKNINQTSRNTLEDVLAIFRRKYVKPQSVATAKHKWHKLTFDPDKQTLPEFLEELNECAERAFGENAQSMIETLLYAKLPPKLKRSVNLAYLENGTSEQIIKHLEREMELNAIENDPDRQMTTVPIPTKTSTPKSSRQSSPSKDKPATTLTCHYCKKPGHLKAECLKLKRVQELQAKGELPPKKTCPTCNKPGHEEKDCWQGANAENHPRNRKRPADQTQENKNDKEPKTEQNKQQNSKN